MPDTADVRRYVRMGRNRMRVEWRRAVLSLVPSPRALDPDRALERLSDSPHVLFLCQGNICRSPMAERYLRARLNERGIHGFTVESAGFAETEDRPSPDRAVTAAGEHGVDLTDHRSTLVTEGMLDRSDVVFLMDAYNDALLRRRFGERAEGSFFLKAFADDDGHEIPDPHGADVEEFRRVYGEIAAALDSFVRRLERDRR